MNFAPVSLAILLGFILVMVGAGLLLFTKRKRLGALLFFLGGFIGSVALLLGFRAMG